MTAYILIHRFLRIVLAAILAFLAAWAWYMVFGDAALRASGVDPATLEGAAPPTLTFALEFGRTLVLSAAMAYLLALLPRGDRGRAVRLVLVTWLGFPAMVLLGSVLWENASLLVAAIHAGEWLVRLVVLGVVLGAGPVGRTRSVAVQGGA